MKKYGFVLIVFTLLGFNSTYSQKIAFIESQKILDNMPEYKTANTEIDKQVDVWKQEVQSKFDQVETLYQNYVDYEAVMADDVKKQKQEEIFKEEQQAKNLKDEIFGQDGKLYELQKSKIGPLQDKIFIAAEKIAIENGYDFIFDKGDDMQWIYMNPEHNLTTLVQENL